MRVEVTDTKLVETSLADGRADFASKQGLTTNLEEVVRDAKVRHTGKVLRPNVRQQVFGRGRRLHLGSILGSFFLLRGGRLGESLAVELSRRRTGNGLDRHKSLRNHVAWERGLEMVSKVRFVEIFFQIRFAHQVGRQIGNTSVVAEDNYGRRYSREGGENVLNFTHLNTETAKFDLAVDAAEEFQLTFSVPPDQVSSGVHAVMFFVIRVVDELFLGEVVAVNVATCHAGAGHAEFTGDPGRKELLAVVKDVRDVPRLGPANGHRAIRLQEICAASYSGFCRTVAVDELTPATRSVHLDNFFVAGLTTNNHQLQSLELVRLHGGQ